MFDQLMLLTDGRLVYIGDARDAVDYFETLHFKCPNLTNTADFFMDITSVDHRSERREGNSRGRVNAFAMQAERRGLGAAAAAAALEALEIGERGGGSGGGGASGERSAAGGDPADEAPDGCLSSYSC